MMDYYTEKNLPKLNKIINKVNPNDTKTVEFHAICHRALNSFNICVLEALVHWQERNWFSRVWVVQEFSLARKATFICGKKSIQAEELLLARQILDLSVLPALCEDWQAGRQVTLRALLNNPLQSFLTSRQRRKALEVGHGTGDTLYRVLETIYVGSSMKATKPCDMIYGLLGLANDTDKLHLHPDYSIESRLDLIYTRTAKAIIAGGHVDLLGLSQHQHQQSGLPSWVPDWRGELRHSFAWQAGRNSKAYFNLCKELKPELVKCADEKILGLMGFYVDKVEEVGQSWDRNNELNYLTQIKRMCLLSAAKDHKIYSAAVRQSEAVWRVLVCDIEQTILYELIRATSSFSVGYRSYLAELEFIDKAKTMTAKQYLKKKQEIENQDPEAHHFRARVIDVGHGRPFLSELGYLGMGPPFLRSGDIIVVFMGASVPYIIRPTSGQSFQLVGECYCDGIMDGEITDIRNKQPFFVR